MIEARKCCCWLETARSLWICHGVGGRKVADGGGGVGVWVDLTEQCQKKNRHTAMHGVHLARLVPLNGYVVELWSVEAVFPPALRVWLSGDFVDHF